MPVIKKSLTGSVVKKTPAAPKAATSLTTAKPAKIVTAMRLGRVQF